MVTEIRVGLKADILRGAPTWHIFTGPIPVTASFLAVPAATFHIENVIGNVNTVRKAVLIREQEERVMEFLP